MMKSDSTQPVEYKGLLLIKGLLLVISFFGGAFGVFFFIWKQNFSASTACLELEITSVLLLNVNATVMKGKLLEKFTVTRMKIVFIVAVILAVATLSSTLGYAALGAMNKQDFQIENNGYYVAIIPASVCCLWSTLLAFESRKHLTTLQANAPGGTVLGQF